LKGEKSRGLPAGKKRNPQKEKRSERRKTALEATLETAEKPKIPEIDLLKEAVGTKKNRKQNPCRGNAEKNVERLREEKIRKRNRRRGENWEKTT